MDYKEFLTNIAKSGRTVSRGEAENATPEDYYQLETGRYVYLAQYIGKIDDIVYAHIDGEPASQFEKIVMLDAIIRRAHTGDVENWGAVFTQETREVWAYCEPLNQECAGIRSSQGLNN